MVNGAVTLREIARALGGEISGGQVKAPGPGHSARDRSLSVGLSNNEDGYVVHSFAGDDAIACKDFVRQKLGYGPWKPNGAGRKNGAKPKLREITYQYRDPAGAIHHTKTRVEYTDGSKTFFFSIKGRTPLLYGGDATKVSPWYDLGKMIYPDRYRTYPVLARPSHSAP